MVIEVEWRLGKRLIVDFERKMEPFIYDAETHRPDNGGSEPEAQES